MWKCPKCGRTFRNTGQDHYCGEAPKTVDEYILMQDEGVRERLSSIREVIRAELPDAEEKIAWSMPTYRKGRNIIHFAAGKNHIGIYPGPEAVEEFMPRLAGYRTSKGAIQLPGSRELPLELVAEIARWCYEKNEEKEDKRDGKER